MVRSILPALTGLLMLGPGTAAAQPYPDRPIKLMVGFTAGGIADHGRADDR